MATANRVILLGARRDGHANVVRVLLKRAGDTEIIGFVDDDAGKHDGEIAGLPILGGTENLAELGATHFVAAVGDCSSRRRLFEQARRAGLDPWNAVDPSATVLSGVRIGAGSVVIAGAVVNVDAALGENVIVNTSASVDHNAVLEDHVNVGPGARLGGRVRIEEGAYLGLGSVVLPDVRVGRWSVVGAGAVVVDDVPAGVVVAGCPARVLRDAKSKEPEP